MNKSLHDQPIDVCFVLLLYWYTGRPMGIPRHIHILWVMHFPSQCYQQHYVVQICYVDRKLLYCHCSCQFDNFKFQSLERGSTSFFQNIFPFLSTQGLLQNLASSNSCSKKKFLPSIEFFLYQTLLNSLLHCNDTQLLGKVLGTTRRMLILFYCMNAIKAQQLSHDFTHNVTDQEQCCSIF